MDIEGAFSTREDARAILVVDDDPQVLKWVCKMLASTGVQAIHSALSGDEAMEIWESHRGEIGVLVTDFVMPGITGDYLAMRLLQDKPDLRVLIMSGNDPNSLDSALPLQSGDNFLQKPFTVAEIQKSIQNLALAE